MLSQVSSLTISRNLLLFYLRRWGVGQDYEDDVSSVRPARALCFEGGFQLWLLVVTMLFASGWACTGGFSSIFSNTPLG